MEALFWSTSTRTATSQVDNTLIFLFRDSGGSLVESKAIAIAERCLCRSEICPPKWRLAYLAASITVFRCCSQASGVRDPLASWSLEVLETPVMVIRRSLKSFYSQIWLKKDVNLVRTWSICSLLPITVIFSAFLASLALVGLFSIFLPEKIQYGFVGRNLN